MNRRYIPIPTSTLEFTPNRLLVSDSTGSIRPSNMNIDLAIFDEAIFDLPEHATSRRDMEPLAPATITMATLYIDESMAWSHIPHQPGA